MRKIALASVMTLVLAGTLAAQYRGGRGGGQTYTGFGNVLFPGAGGPPPIRHTSPTFAQRLGSTISGGGHSGRPSGGHGRGGGLGYAYAVPVYYGGYGYGYGYGQQQPEQPVTVVNQPPQQPTVIINQYYGQDGGVRSEVRNSQDGNTDGIRSYQAPIPSNPEPSVASAPREPASPVSEQKPTIYLIAYKDGAIRGSLAYWIEADTLHYITAQGLHNSASIDLIDKAFSEQLNKERNIEFSLAMQR